MEKKENSLQSWQKRQGQKFVFHWDRIALSVPSTFYHKFELFSEEWKLEQEPTKNNQLNIIEKLSF